MTPTASARVANNPAPFTPSVFPFPDPAEVCVPAVQKTSFRPTKAVPADFTPSFPIALPPVSKRGIRQRKTLRTVMHEPDGTLKGAKIDLATGEVIPHQYKNYFEQGPRARIDPNAPDLEPFWMQMPAATRSTGVVPKHDKSRKKLHNGCKIYLQYLQRSDDLEYALLAIPFTAAITAQLPMLMEIIDSANRLDMGGNTRGLSRTLLLMMLANLDVITPATVQKFMDCSVRHSQRVAGCLRVIINAFMMLAEK